MVLIVGLVHLWKIQRSYQGVRAAFQSSLGRRETRTRRGLSPARSHRRFLPRKCSLAHISAHRTVSHHRSKLTQIPRTEGVFLVSCPSFRFCCSSSRKSPRESVLQQMLVQQYPFVEVQRLKTRDCCALRIVPVGGHSARSGFFAVPFLFCRLEITKPGCVTLMLPPEIAVDLACMLRFETLTLACWKEPVLTCIGTSLCMGGFNPYSLWSFTCVKAHLFG